MNIADIKTDLKKIIVDVANLDLDPKDLPEKSHLTGDEIGLDSIDILELVVHLDKKYGIKIRNNDEGKTILNSIESLSLAIANKNITE